MDRIGDVALAGAAIAAEHEVFAAPHKIATDQIDHLCLDQIDVARKVEGAQGVVRGVVHERSPYLALPKCAMKARQTNTHGFAQSRTG